MLMKEVKEHCQRLPVCYIVVDVFALHVAVFTFSNLPCGTLVLYEALSQVFMGSSLPRCQALVHVM